MVREVITISIGQGGIQLSECIWKQYCIEHHIGHDAHFKAYWTKHGPTKYLNTTYYDLSFLTYFEQTESNEYVPRSLMVDLEPNVIDDIKISNIKKLFHPEFLLSGTEDAANIFARGHYTVGKEIMDTVNDRLRKLTDKCDNVMGFIIPHSVGGGTGSGLGSLILERIAVDYRKKSKNGFEIYPSPTISTCVVEPYNALLTTHWLLDHTEVSIILDNEALYEICANSLDIKSPSYDDINRLCAKMISAYTSEYRYEPELNVDIYEFQTNLVPFPRLHFMITSMAPIATAKKLETMRTDVHGLSEKCFDSKNFSVKIDDFDGEQDKYMAICAYFYNIKHKEAYANLQELKENKKVSFVEWCPTGFKCGWIDFYDGMASVEGDKIAKTERNVFMVGNNTAISRVFKERISRKYDLLYNERAFVHWYVGEGMEESEFDEAREDLGWLEKDYLDVLSEQTFDEEDDEDDED